MFLRRNSVRVDVCRMMRRLDERDSSFIVRFCTWSPESVQHVEGDMVSTWFHAGIRSEHGFLD